MIVRLYKFYLRPEVRFSPNGCSSRRANDCLSETGVNLGFARSSGYLSRGVFIIKGFIDFMRRMSWTTLKIGGYNSLFSLYPNIIIEEFNTYTRARFLSFFIFPSLPLSPPLSLTPLLLIQVVGIREDFINHFRKRSFWKCKQETLMTYTFSWMIKKLNFNSFFLK